jgi:Protein of unknown function (DUF3800)
MRKLVFIDESGDSGLKPGSSLFFVIAFVIFDDYLEAEKLALELKILRRKLFNNDYQEFHFTKDSIAVKQSFFDVLKINNLTIYAQVINKKVIHTDTIHHKNLYKIFLLEGLGKVMINCADAKVQIDGDGSRQYKRDMISAIKQVARSSSITLHSVSFSDSKNNILIQVADMCAGVIRRKYENTKPEYDRIYQSISRKITIV